VSNSPEKKKSGREWVDSVNQLKVLSQFGFVVFANVAVCGFIGYWLDRWTFHNRILFIISLFFGILSGLVNGIRELLKEVRLLEEAEKKKKERQKNDSA